MGELYAKACSQRDTWEKRSLSGAHELAMALQQIDVLKKKMQEKPIVSPCAIGKNIKKRKK